MNVIYNFKNFIQKHARNRRVLFVGVGNEMGQISGNARAVKDVAAALYGIEIDPVVVRGNPDWNIQLLDLNLPIETKLPDVDLIVITEVIEHLQSPIASLRNLGRLLPGTAVVGSVPNALSFGRIVSAAWSQRRYRAQDGNHLMLFNEQTLGKTLSQAGLQDIHIHAYDSRPLLRPFVSLRPDFSQGLLFTGVFPRG